MDVYHIAKLLKSGVATHQYRNLLNYIGSMHAKGMTAEYAPVGSGKKLE